MRGGTVQINWHDLQPVLSLDFHPASRRLATAGADHDVKVPFLPYPLAPLPNSPPSISAPHFHFLTDAVAFRLLQIWVISSDGSESKLPTATFQSGLVPNGTAHSSAVNVLRFSPSGTAISAPFEPIEFIPLVVVVVFPAVVVFYAKLSAYINSVHSLRRHN